MLLLRHAHIDFRSCRQVGCARCRGRRGSAVAFPCCFPARPSAGKIFSLPAGSGKMAQRFDVTSEYRSNREDFGAETKIFPAVSLLAGKNRAGGSRRKGRRDDPRGRLPVIRIAVLAAVIALAAAGEGRAGMTTIQRSMSTTSGSGASCSQANDCGSCSITCPVGKAAICQSGTDRPTDDRGRPRCPPPACFCQ